MGIKQIVALVLLSTIMLTGCTNSTFDKSMEEGKLALASKEYEKANGLFGLAVEEKPNDKEAKDLNEGTEKIIAINKLNAEGNLEEAIKLCDEFENSNIESGLILKEAENIEEELQSQLNKIDNNKKNMEVKITEAESLVKDKKYTEAKELLNELAKEINNDDLLDKVNLLLEECNTKPTQAEPKKSLTSQKAMEILYQKVGTDLSYEFAGDLGNDFHVYGESGSNFYCFYPSQGGMQLEGAYYVHKATGKVYEAYPDGTINEL